MRTTTLSHGEAKAGTIATGRSGLENSAPLEDAALGALPVDCVLQKRVDRALCDGGYMPLRDLQVFAARGLVVLRGAVPSYHLKQLAQATAIGVPGVTKVCNELEIVSRRKTSRQR